VGLSAMPEADIQVAAPEDVRDQVTLPFQHKEGE
jgi:hypothetical protein